MIVVRFGFAVSPIALTGSPMAVGVGVGVGLTTTFLTAGFLAIGFLTATVLDAGFFTAEKEIAGLKGRLTNPNFADKAPAEVVLECGANLREAEAQADLARKRLGDLD